MMKTLLFPFLITGITFANTPSLEELTAQSREQAEAFKEDAYRLIEDVKIQQATKSCSSCQNKEFLKEQISHSKKPKQEEKLLIFVSSSLPKESLKALFHQAQEIGATLVFQGLIDDSFQKTKTYFEEMEIGAEINPPLFEEYGIKAVPTFVLREGDTHDSVQGNISLAEALTLIKDKGDLKDQAKALLEGINRRAQ